MPESWNILYNVAGMSQPTPVTCWATSFAVVINFRDGSNITPIDVCNTVGRDPNTPETWDEIFQAAAAYGLNQSAGSCMTVDGWGQMLQDYGPLWVCINYEQHAVVVNGLQSDGTDEGTTFYVTDPWAGPEALTPNSLNGLFEMIGASQPVENLAIWHR